ncbi:MAG: hypothetical protein WC455_30825 [Dehalococcoidia bacterium]|jgi:hypothetical protein
MKFKIPQQFKLGSRTIKVKTVKKCQDSDDKVDGQAIYAKGLVELKETIFPNQEYADFVFFHELTHHILNHLAYEKLARDETFVDRFADALLQAIKTME